jgi:hypothetical protein
MRPDLLLLQLWQSVLDRLSGADRDRGDVPGWVMVTVMTAGLVVALLAFAKKPLQDAFANALESVQGG